MNKFEKAVKILKKSKKDMEISRFDGDIFWFTDMFFEKHAEYQKRFFGKNTKALFLYCDNIFYYCHDLKEGFKLGKQIYNKYKNDFGKFTKNFDLLKNKAQIDFDNLLKTKNKDFKKNYEKSAESMQLFAGFSINAIECVEDYIYSILKKSIKDEKKLSLLLTPFYDSYTSENEKELIKILESTSKNKFGQKTRFLLEKHAEKWGWVYNNYASYKLANADLFEKELLEISNNLNKINANRNNLQMKRNEKKKLLAKLPASTRKIINFVDELYELRDKRKEFYIKSVVPFKNWLKYIAKQKKTDFETLKWLKFNEQIDFILNNKKDILNVAKKRKKTTIMLCGFVDDYNLFDGEEGLKIKNILLEVEKADIFHGFPANPGNVKGKILVIKSNKDFYKFEKGAILVASHTTPDYVSLMKKAKAILTERGGITSHAAIVSRELNVPCIVGIKDLTGNLKDGDEVEVNAGKGIVKILKRN
jgi:phosphohistidine swiveling domain-containing protein